MKALAVTAGIVFWTLVLGTVWLAFFPGDTVEPIAVLQIEPDSQTEAAAPPEDSTESAAAPADSQPSFDPPAVTDSVPALQPPAETDEGGLDLPPGFAVTGPADSPQGPAAAPAPQGTTLLPSGPMDQRAPAPPELAPDDSAPPDGDQGAIQAPEQSAAAEQDEEAVAPESPAATVAEASPQASAGQAEAAPEAVQETGSISLPAVPVAELVEESQYGPLPKIAADGRRPVEVYARPSRYAANAGAGGPVRVAVLVNGLGLPDSPSADVLKGLPAPISVAYGAYGRSLQDLIEQVRADGHEVLLQIPLEPNNYPTEDPGPHTLLTTLPNEENLKRLQWLMSRYTGYVGVTNHMGAKFETARDSFLPVLEELKRRGLLYLDDGTAQGSTAGQIASVLGLDYSVAHVQIDTGQSSPAEIAKALAQLEAMARERGAAIGVARAKPTTIKQIADWAGKLEGKGIVLVPVSAAVKSQRQS